MCCIFCKYQEWEERPYFENQLCIGVFDKFPVNQGHVLIVPKRHVQTYFELTLEERMSMDSLLRLAKRHLDTRYKPDGYNVGLNCGEASGQTVMHCHMHLIPRYKGDMEDPRGGVRGVIPKKQKY